MKVFSFSSLSWHFESASLETSKPSSQSFLWLGTKSSESVGFYLQWTIFLWKLNRSCFTGQSWYFVGEVLCFLQSKRTFAFVSMGPELLSPQDFISGQFSNSGYGSSSLDQRSLLDTKPAAFPSPSFLPASPLYPKGHSWRRIITAKGRILFYQSKPSMMNLWPLVRHASGSTI